MNINKLDERIAGERMLQNFLSDWPIEDLVDMTLTEYNDVGIKKHFANT